MGTYYEHPEFVELKKKIRENSKGFVFVVGAGLSKPAGLPDWMELKDRIIEDARKWSSGFNPEDKDTFCKELDRISKFPSDDLWQCFTSLKKLLDENTYTDFIRNHLSVDKSKIPPTYDLVWKLRPKGIVSFNLDNCAIDSYAKVNQCSVDFATHKDAVRFKQYISNDYDFLFQPHGIHSDSSTWVLTEDEKTNLLNLEAYKKFVQVLLSAKQVVFIGFNPSDFSFSYLIQDSLFDSGSTGSKHYIFLSQPERRLIDRYSQKNIGVIPYVPSNDDHPEINDYLSHILSFISFDEIPSSAFSGQTVNESEIPPDEELEKNTPDIIRKLLNGAVLSILPDNGEPSKDDYEKLTKFYKNYAGSLNRAWFVQPETRFDLLGEYRLTREIGQGNFGKVYEAYNEETGKQLAVKVLLPHVKSNQDYLLCFRRGVRSMRILTENNVEGMVRLENALEVPACIIMDFVEGLNLNEAMERKILDEFDVCINTLVQVGKIIHRAHSLKETVLHRDLKPSNVLLKDYYTNGESIDVVVVDFDLSWYKGAIDTYIGGVRDKGYAAPEQLNQGKNYRSVRDTLVDVFGYGMLAYFLLVGNDPRENEHKFENFTRDTINRVKSRFFSPWDYMPIHLTNIINKCVKDDQSKRIPFYSALEAFVAIHELNKSNYILPNNPLVLGEMGMRLTGSSGFSMNDFDRKITFDSHDGSKKAEISLRNDKYGHDVIRINLAKTRAAHEGRYVTQKINTVKEKAESIFTKKDFSIIDVRPGTSRIDIIADWMLEDRVNIDMVKERTDAVSEVWATMNF